MTVLAQTAAPRAQKTDGGLYDILDLILDRGLVIDVFIRVSVIGIEILRVDIRIVIASVDTYLRFAAATNRLDLENRGTPVVTPAPALFAPALPTAVAPANQAAVAPGAAATLAPGTVVAQGQPATVWPSGTGAAVPVVGNLGQTVGQALGTVGQTVGGVVGAVTPTVGGLVQGVAPTVDTVVGTVGRTAGTVVGAVAPAATTVVGSVVPAASGVSAVVPTTVTAAPVTDVAAHSAGEVGVVEQVPVRSGQESADASVPPAAGHQQDPPAVQTPAAEQAPAAAPGKPRGGKGQQGGEA